MFNRKSLIIVFGIFIYLVSSTILSAKTLSWEPSPGNVTGYKIYYGKDPYTYLGNVDVGNVMKPTLAGTGNILISFITTIPKTSIHF